MSKAKASDGQGRFADFEGAKDNNSLAKLQEYNVVKREEQLEQAENIRDSALKDHDKQSSKDVVNQAFLEFKNGDLKYNEYISILESIEKTSGNMTENSLRKEATENFLDYLNDRDMMGDYLDDHQAWNEYIVDNWRGIATKYGTGNIPFILKKVGYNLNDFAKYTKQDEPKVTKGAKDLNNRSSKWLKYSKGAGTATLGIGLVAGSLTDVYGEADKTWGEAITHNTASLSGTAVGLLVTGAAVMAGASPVGWAAAAGVAIGVGVTSTFEKFYEENKFGLQDKLDAAGEKVDEYVLEPVGEAISSGWDAINPFS